MIHRDDIVPAGIFLLAGLLLVGLIVAAILSEVRTDEGRAACIEQGHDPRTCKDVWP